MARSMTAFARCADEGEWGTVVWEVRSVNHRYLDCNVRLPEPLHPLEMQIRERVRHMLSRGKVECSVRFHASAKAVGGLSIDTDLVDQLSHAIAKTHKHLDNLSTIDPLAVLSWPGVLQTRSGNPTGVHKVILSLFDATLKELIVVREREGKALEKVIEKRLVRIASEVEKVKKRLPKILEGQKGKMRARFDEIKGELDETRLEQEMLFFTQKIDVSEEMDRLEAHVKEMRYILAGEGALGKRLDFQIQELNREANTLASKSVDTQTTKSAVEMKVLIEQMREQVQNIE